MSVSGSAALIASHTWGPINPRANSPKPASSVGRVISGIADKRHDPSLAFDRLNDRAPLDIWKACGEQHHFPVRLPVLRNPVPAGGVSYVGIYGRFLRRGIAKIFQPAGQSRGSAAGINDKIGMHCDRFIVHSADRAGHARSVRADFAFPAAAFRGLCVAGGQPHHTVAGAKPNIAAAAQALAYLAFQQASADTKTEEI